MTHAECTKRIKKLESRLRESHAILNDLLSLFIMKDGTNWNTVNDGFDTLAANRGVLDDLPVTASFADEVEKRMNTIK